jgi:signal transduction histidine kinase
MLRLLKRTSGIFRNQILYVFIGTGIGYTAGVLNYCPWYRIPIPPFLNPLVSIYVAFASYAIIKYRLLDINVALTRAGVFIAVYPLILGVPFWIGFKYLGKGPWIMPASIMAAFATAGPFIYLFLQRRAEEALLKERRRYQETINNLSETMIDIRDIDKLFSTITPTITEAIKIKFVLIYLKQEQYNAFQLKSCYPKEAKSEFEEFIPLDDPLIGILNQRKKPQLGEEVSEKGKIKLDSGVAIPCFSKEGLIAFVILGAKQNGQMYTNDDLLVLETFSYTAGSTIENCIHCKNLENQQRMYRIEEMHTFSYSLAHEIDNPMTIIIRGLEVLKRDFAEYIDSEPELKKFIELIDMMREGALRVSRMVKAVQEFGQRTSSAFTIVKLEKVIETFLNLYLPHFKMNGVVFTKDIPDEPFPLIRGVPQEIEQTLLILAKNAVQALIDTKEKRVHLKAEVINSDWIRISLTDNGPGIEKEKLLDIFTAFYTTKGTKEGTGMGLYNATHFIVERHKGRIWAESDGPGKGATFFVELPIAKDIKPEEVKEEKKKSNIIKLD